MKNSLKINRPWKSNITQYFLQVCSHLFSPGAVSLEMLTGVNLKQHIIYCIEVQHAATPIRLTKKTLSENCTEGPWKVSGICYFSNAKCIFRGDPQQTPHSCEALTLPGPLGILPVTNWGLWFTLCVLACRLQGALMFVSSISLKWDSCKCTVLSLWFIQLLPSTMFGISEHHIALLPCWSVPTFAVLFFYFWKEK